jgi:hypothetical protein
MCVRHVVFPAGHISYQRRNRHFEPALESLEATWQVIFHVNSQGSTLKGKYGWLGAMEQRTGLRAG